MREDKTGFVYVMAKESSPSYFKIGRTERKPQLRATELDGTDSPTPSIVVYFVYCNDCEMLETTTHRLLEYARVRQNREWFKCDLSNAIDAIQSAADEHSVEIYHERFLLGNDEISDQLGGNSIDDGTGEAKVIYAINSIFPIISRNDSEVIRYKKFYNSRLQELREKEILGENIATLKSMAESAFTIKLREINEEMNESLKNLIENYRKSFGFNDDNIDQLYRISESIKNKKIKQKVEKISDSIVPKSITRTFSEFVDKFC